MTSRTRIFVALIWLTSIQLFCIGTTYGQGCQDETAILLKVFMSITPKQIVYVDTVNANSYVPEHLEQAFQNGTLTDIRNSDSITLSEREFKHILSNLGQQTVWPDSLFPNSKRIDSDSILTYWRNLNTQRRDLVDEAIKQKDTETLKNIKNDYSYVFTFLKPIYIRDNTVCLISFAATCGYSCGHSETSFYKKENNEWIKWIVVAAGNF